MTFRWKEVRVSFGELAEELVRLTSNRFSRYQLGADREDQPDLAGSPIYRLAPPSVLSAVTKGIRSEGNYSSPLNNNYFMADRSLGFCRLQLFQTFLRQKTFPDLLPHRVGTTAAMEMLNPPHIEGSYYGLNPAFGNINGSDALNND
ncbi:unnamed protein product [Nezara viridula]|uniref:Uncharacterized protein n=1 Tax=Nezara viridula TaxID=85310 RepID=A0A9P0HCA5_NEZVI|nr:unnamed protein product [Nezara viridula]